MGLRENADYVFFPKVHVVESRMTAQMSDACLVGTKRYLFVVPVRSLQSYLVATGITTYGSGKHGEIAEQVRAINIRGKGNKQRARHFYSERLLA